MNCCRCQSDVELESSEDDVDKATNENCRSPRQDSDIGGFAELAGCLQNLKSSEKQVPYHTIIQFYHLLFIFLACFKSFSLFLFWKTLNNWIKFQVGTPLEEDLISWGHHFNSISVPDDILQASAGDEVWHWHWSLVSALILSLGKVIYV